jgi:hypothetical protein
MTLEEFKKSINEALDYVEAQTGIDQSEEREFLNNLNHD